MSAPVEPMLTTRVGHALFHEAGCDEDRCLGLASEGEGGLLRFFDGIVGRDDLNCEAVDVFFVQLSLNALRNADKEDSGAVSGRRNSALDDFGGGVVASHGIKRYAKAASIMRGHRHVLVLQTGPVAMCVRHALVILSKSVSRHLSRDVRAVRLSNILRCNAHLLCHRLVDGVRALLPIR